MTRTAREDKMPPRRDPVQTGGSQQATNTLTGGGVVIVVVDIMSLLPGNRGLIKLLYRVYCLCKLCTAVLKMQHIWTGSCRHEAGRLVGYLMTFMSETSIFLTFLCVAAAMVEYYRLQDCCWCCCASGMIDCWVLLCCEEGGARQLSPAVLLLCFAQHIHNT